MLLLTVAAYAASAEDHGRRHNYMLSDDFIDEINREATTWRAGRNFHPLTSTNYIKVCLFSWENWYVANPPSLSENRRCSASTRCTRSSCRR